MYSRVPVTNPRDAASAEIRDESGAVPPEIWSRTCRAYEPTLAAVLKFELLAAFGRLFLRRRPPDVEVGGVRLLNIGSGLRPLAGWVNADFFRWPFWRTPVGYWPVDLRYPLPCRDDHWDGAFTEHTLEHLAAHDARSLLHEILRTLRPGAWLRVVVPDLALYVNYYLGGVSDPLFSARWPQRADALWALTQNYGHRSLWDAGSACAALREAGFADVRAVRFGEGTDRRLVCDAPERRWESLYVEGRKP